MTATTPYVPLSVPLPTRYWEFATARVLDFPPIEWRVPELLPVGLTVCVAPPKIGKTWLGMQIEHYLTRGVPLFGHKPDRLSDAMALDLEGNVRRTKARSWVLHPHARDDPEAAGDVFYLHANDEAYAAVEGGVLDRIAWLGRELDAAAAYGRRINHVRIDTLRLFLGARPREANAYDYDAIIGRALDEFAHTRNLSVLAAHHTKKNNGEEDWLERVSGSTGIAGSASAIWLLDRARGSVEGVLHATMRDGDEVERAVRFERGRWSFAEDVTTAQARHTGGPRSVLDVLHRRIVATFAELVEATGIEPRTLTKTLDRLRAEGAIESAGGRWRLVEDVAEDPAPALVEAAEVADVDTDPESPSGVTDELTPTGADGERRDDGPNRAIPALLESIKAVRAFTVQNIRREAREREPWSMAEDWQTGRHVWTDDDTVAELVEAGGWDVVVLDRNASYPSVLSSVPVATSTLVHTGGEPYEPRRAGVYLIRPPAWPIPGRPHPLGIVAADDEPAWVTAPHMDLLTKRGIAVDVLDSWTGQRSAAVFERFHRWARDARAEAAEAGAEALTETKRQTNVAIRSLWPKSDDGRGRIWRPDWWASVVAESNVRHWVRADSALADGVRVVGLRNTDETAIAVPADVGTEPADLAAAVAPYVIGTAYKEVKVKARLALADWLAYGYRTEPRNYG